jgi:carbamate kinase
MEVGAELLVIATDVDGVLADFGTDKEKLIQRLSVKEARAFLNHDHTGKGSMEPKVAAAVQFLEQGGKRVVITCLDAIVTGVKGTAGTQIVCG